MMQPVLGLTRTYGDQTFLASTDLTLNVTTNNLGITDLGGTYTNTISSFTWIDSSGNATLCTDSFVMNTGGDGSVASGSNTTFSGSQGGNLSIDTRYVGLYAAATFNSSLTNCSYTGISIAYQNELSDVVSGLPTVGDDIGNFLANLAPGIGTFMIIIGIFAGVASIIAVMVLVIRRKVGNN